MIDVDARERAEAVVRALQAAIRGRIDRASHAVFRGFENSRGQPDVVVDEQPVAAFTRRSWSSVRALVSHSHPQVRQAAVWALATDRSARVAGPLLDLLTDQRHAFDHDYAYGAARRVGLPLVAPLERTALRSRAPRRTFAIECLGMTRAGRPAVAALRRVVQRHGFVTGTLDALYNVHHPDAVAVAARALADEDPNVRLDAIAAVLGGLEASGRPLAANRVPALVRRVHAAIADPRTWRDPDDPWASLLCFGLDVLQMVEPDAASTYARDCLANGAHAEHRRELARHARRRAQRRE